MVSISSVSLALKTEPNSSSLLYYWTGSSFMTILLISFFSSSASSPLSSKNWTWSDFMPGGYKPLLYTQRKPALASKSAVFDWPTKYIIPVFVSVSKQLYITMKNSIYITVIYKQRRKKTRLWCSGLDIKDWTMTKTLRVEFVIELVYGSPALKSRSKMTTIKRWWLKDEVMLNIA